MQLITIILVALTALISACSMHKSTPTEDVRIIDPTTESTSVNSTAVESTTIDSTINTTINSTSVPTPSTQPKRSNELLNEGAATQALINPQPTVSIDLLERIRQGFRFPDIDSKYTSQYVEWNVNHPTFLKDLFSRAEPFLYYIVEEIDKRGLPMELALLPAIESAFKPDALSRSKASGLWQFIPSTGKSFGLRQDWWYDGRRDLISSTKAALDYLTQLNKKFNGDWHLTLAAYNAGQGTVSRAIKSNYRKGKKTDYQSLSLRTETVKYIPKLQALKDIVKNPSRYNVFIADIPNQPYFEILNLSRQIDLHHFSDLAKLDIKAIQHLNAGYLRWATPTDGPYRLLTPLSNHIQSSIALQKIKSNPNIEYTQHTISNGESLSHISQHYGVSVSALQNTNQLSGTAISAGKTLIIPIAKRTQPISSNTPSNATNNSKTKRIHRVVKGDTLWSISQRYNVELRQLLSWNQLTKNQILRLNQSLLIFLN